MVRSAIARSVATHSRVAGIEDAAAREQKICRFVTARDSQDFVGYLGAAGTGASL